MYISYSLLVVNVCWNKSISRSKHLYSAFGISNDFTLQAVHYDQRHNERRRTDVMTNGSVDEIFCQLHIVNSQYINRIRY